MAGKPVRVSWELEAQASVAETWALFSDTDRYNQAVGFGFTFEDNPLEDGQVERTGTASVLGMRYVWDELPFEYRENEWYKIRRTFRSGPAGDVNITLRLAPRGEYTAIRYAIEVVPRNALTRPLVQLELKGKTAPKITPVLERMIKRLEDPSVTIDVVPKALSKAASDELEAKRAQMTHAEVGRHLAQTITEGPLTLQNQLDPIRVARLWKLELDETVRGLLEATKLGLVSMQWDLLCPMCRGPKFRTETFTLDPPPVHCGSCNIRYDGSFADAIAVSFRTSPKLRTFEVAPACIGSPSLQPQVLAQDNVEPGVVATITMELKPGVYRIRCIPKRQTASILVEEGGQSSSETFVIGPREPSPQRSTMKAGLCQIVLRNASTHRITVCLDQRHLPKHIMTAGQFLERYNDTGLIPQWLFDPAQRLRKTVACVAAVQVANWAPAVFEALERWSQSVPSARLKQDGSVVVVAFDDLPSALEALRPILGHKDMSVSLGTGEIIQASVEAFVSPFGSLVEDTLLAVSGCLPGRMSVLAQAEPTLRDPLSQAGWGLSDTPTRLGRGTMVYTGEKHAD